MTEAVTATDWKGRPVLVTGGAGFVGSHLVEALVERGADVTVLDCLERPLRLQHVEGRIAYLNADLADSGWSKSITRAFERVFHLAAFSQLAAAQDQPETAYRQNVIGMVNLLQLAKQWSVKKLLFTSAGGLYTYKGRATATNFFSTYSCKYDHGIFEMTRPTTAP